MLEATAGLGPYRLEARIATGGMAEVFRARRQFGDGIEKKVALKRIRPEFAQDPEFVALFSQEARVAMQLAHPSLVTVYDFGTIDQHLFLAMELVDGVDLRKLRQTLHARDELLAVPLCLYIVWSVAKGLDHAHRLTDERGRPLGLVHQDVGHPNILLSWDGAVKLTDFGVAHLESQADRRLRGRIGYMSPEQIGGDALDQRSDIFALGVVLHELLTGQRLFRGSDVANTLWRNLHAPIPQPSHLRPEVSPDLDQLVLSALQRDRAQRLPDARSFARALAPWVGSAEERSEELAALLTARFSRGETVLPEGPRTTSTFARTGETDVRPFEDATSLMTAVTVRLGGPEESETVVDSAFAEAEPLSAWKPATVEGSGGEPATMGGPVAATDSAARKSDATPGEEAAVTGGSTPVKELVTSDRPFGKSATLEVTPAPKEALVGKPPDPRRRRSDWLLLLGLGWMILGLGGVVWHLTGYRTVTPLRETVETPPEIRPVVADVPRGTPEVVTPKREEAPRERTITRPKVPEPAVAPPKPEIPPAPEQAPTPVSTPVEAQPVVEARPAMGTLSVRLREGWGHLKVDGKTVRGTTPIVGFPLTAGPHLVQVEIPSSGKVYSRQITVVADEDLALEFAP